MERGGLQGRATGPGSGGNDAANQPRWCASSENEAEDGAVVDDAGDVGRDSGG